MSTKFYKGLTPLLSQPSVGNQLLGRAYIGNNRVYGEAPFTWTPAEAVGTKYWWRADLGVTLSGTDVLSWEDQIAGHTLTPGAGTSPKFVSADTTMNNKPAINFGTVGTNEVLANTTEIAAGTNGTLFWFVISTTTNANGGNQIVGGGKGLLGASGWEAVIQTNTPTAANTFSTYTFRVGPSGGDTTNTGIAVSSTETSWVGVSHTQTTKTSFYRNGTEVVVGTGGLNPTSFAFTAGNYTQGGTLQYRGRILECGWLTRPYWDSADELLLNEYLNLRYGL